MLFTLYVAFYALANQFAGGKYRQMLYDLTRIAYPGRSIYWAGLVAMLFGWFTAGLVGALAGFSFLLWRLPGWYGTIDAGTNEGEVVRDVTLMALRGLVAAPVFLHVFFEGQQDKLAAIQWEALVVWATACAGQGAAYWLGNHVLYPRTRFWDAGFWSEGLAGAVWGAAFYGVVV